MPLPDDLALLPLPFVDPQVDRVGRVPLVLGSPLTPERIRLASLLSGAFAIELPLDLQFPVSVGALPEESAVVLLDGPQAAAALGLPAPKGPSIRLVDHPGHPGLNVKLLVLEGRTSAELETAVRRLEEGSWKLAGPEVVLKESPTEQPMSAPYDAPRWVRPDRAMSLSELPGGDALALDGLRNGPISVHFRLAPDLWAWPTEFVQLDLGYTVKVPVGLEAPRLDVLFNGNFLATLPRLPPERDESAGRAKLWLRRDQLRGFNELVVHVNYQGLAQACGEAPVGEARVSLTPDSVLHLEDFGHFVSLPDIARVVYDGFPFTRLADLSETALVLPPAPKPEELSAALSMLAHFAAITGRVGSGLTVIIADESFGGSVLDKDLLLVGTFSDHPLLRRWAARLPLSFATSPPRVQMPEQNSALLSLLEGRRGFSELELAAPLAGRAKELGALMGMESPLAKGREVVVLTAARAAQIPSQLELQGFADSRGPGGDLLMTATGLRWMYKLGPAFNRGQLDRWSTVRWFMANHWLLLIPCAMLGCLALALAMRGFLARKLAARLGPTPAP